MHPSHGWAKLPLTGEKPVIAAINGAAAGAGSSLAMMCDFAILADNAYFKAGFPGLGAAPDDDERTRLRRGGGDLGNNDARRCCRRFAGIDQASAESNLCSITDLLSQEAMTQVIAFGSEEFAEGVSCISKQAETAISNAQKVN